MVVSIRIKRVKKKRRTKLNKQKLPQKSRYMKKHRQLQLFPLFFNVALPCDSSGTTDYKVVFWILCCFSGASCIFTLRWSLVFTSFLYEDLSKQWQQWTIVTRDTWSPGVTPQEKKKTSNRHCNPRFTIEHKANLVKFSHDINQACT